MDLLVDLIEDFFDFLIIEFYFCDLIRIDMVCNNLCRVLLN